MVSDWGPPQFDDPSAENYATVHTSGDATVTASHDPRGHVRPWTNAVVIDGSEGTLREGDTVTLVLGDRSRGSPGVRAQSFAEAGFEFRIVVDVFETGDFMAVPGELTFDVVGGEATFIDAVAPSNATPDEALTVGVRARDRWGDIADGCTDQLRIHTDHPATVPDSDE